jgi:D-3-phosphoglycerate dehydrogenase / 2-oxoglutarate reductase
LGVLGLGNIGRAVARSAELLGMQIHFYDTRQVSVELGTEMGWIHHKTIEELFRSVDCVTVHLSARDIRGSSNEGILHERHLMTLGADRPSGPRIFINFARGFIHTPENLINAIAKGSIRKAAVDVYPSEPRRGDGWTNPYENCKDVMVYPHIGASTQEAQPRIARRVSETFAKFSKMGSVRDTPFQPRTQLQLSDAGDSGQALLIVCHSTARGTKRAIDEAIYEAGASNMSSVHKDFKELGFAYDLALLDGPLSQEQIEYIIIRAEELTGVENTIRSVRQVSL